jgi:hypothetical protein
MGLETSLGIVKTNKLGLEAEKRHGISKVTTITMKKTMMLTMTAWGWKPHLAQSRTSKLGLEAEML